MKLFAAVAAVVLIAGTASAQQAGAPAAAAPDAQTFTGWVKVVNGEFQLYERQRQVSEPFARPCVSVVLPRGLQRSSGDISGMQVAFSGRAVPWSERDTPQIMRFKGSRVANDCGGDTVIQADTYRVLSAG